MKRMGKVIFLTRLPTGHTHEDIDGIWYMCYMQCFGILN